MIYRYLLALAFAILMGCTNSPSVDYTDEYTRTSDDNRAVHDTQEAMNTDDVVDTLSTMLGAADQNRVVVASNVRFVNHLDELNEPAYTHYNLRIADNISLKRDMKDGYGKAYSKDSLSNLVLRLEDIKMQHPHAVVALNKQDKIIAVALDSLEAQALAQKNPRVFYVLQGQTLKQTVGRWSKQAHWTMRWLIEKDYTMIAPATIFGEFSTQGGSLDQLLGTLRYLDQPLKAQFTRNNVVVIRENTYNSGVMAVMP